MSDEQPLPPISGNPEIAALTIAHLDLLRMFAAAITMPTQGPGDAIAIMAGHASRIRTVCGIFGIAGPAETLAMAVDGIAEELRQALKPARR